MAEDVKTKLKELIISELNLEGKSPGDIDDGAPLFGEGLGLDSLDALQLAMVVEEHFGVQVPEGDEARPIFASVNALATHIAARSCGTPAPGSRGTPAPGSCGTPAPGSCGTPAPGSRGTPAAGSA